LHLHFITLGRKLASHEHVWIHDFLKRIEKFTPTSHQHYKDKFDMHKDQNDPKYVKWCEGLIPASTYLVVLDERGRSLSTRAWTDILFETRTIHKHITFLIGGSYGLPESIKAKARLKLSLTPMTLPHRLAFLVLLEQTYRAFTIDKNMPYHH